MGSGSSGGLASALQSEIKKRQLKKNGQKKTSAAVLTNPNIKPSSIANKNGMNGSRKNQVSPLKNDAHDQLMAEFKKVHKKMFTSSSTEEEEENSNEIEAKVNFSEEFSTSNDDER